VKPFRWPKRAELARPTAMRWAASALGVALTGLPSVSPHADVRAFASLGVLAMVAAVAVVKPALTTFGCAAGMSATALACVHGAPAGLAVGDALLLLGYLLVADLAAAPGELRLRAGAAILPRLKLFGTGAAVVVAVAALSLVEVGHSFFLAIGAVVAAVVAVAALLAGAPK
jgi:hypothetical protein